MIHPPQPRFRFYNGYRNHGLALRDVACYGMFQRDLIEEAERQIAGWLSVPEIILTPQGRYGIYLGLLETIRPGQQVILSPYTLYDVVNMVIAAGGIPCFADIEEQTCNISAGEVERLIGPETGAVLVTHLHGLIAPIDRIRAACESYGVPLLEDACQAFGAMHRSSRAGTIGDMGFYSFGRAKNVNAFLGGAIALKDRAKANRIRRRLAGLPYEDGWRLLKRMAHCFLGQTLTTPIIFSAFTYWVFRYGVLHGVDAVTRQFDTEADPVLRPSVPANYERRMTGMQAGLILDQLDRVDTYSQDRIEVSMLYHAGLADIPGIILPPSLHDLSHIYLSFPVQVEDRKELQRYMMKKGRDVVIQHIGNTADYGCFQHYYRDCPVARLTAKRVLLLPTYPDYRTSEAQKNVNTIRQYFLSGNVKHAFDYQTRSESSLA